MKKDRKIWILFVLIFAGINMVFGQSYWRAQNSGTTENLNAVSFINSQEGWAVGDNGIVLKTTNGGLTWNKLTIQGVNEFHSVKFFNSNTGLIATWDTVYKTTNGGSSWSGIWMGTTNNYFHSFYFLDENNGWCAGDVGAVFKTTSGGDFWLFLGTQQIMDMYDVHFVNSDNGYSCGWGGALWRSRDGGMGWVDIYDWEVMADLWGVSFGDTATGWCVGDSGVIIKTTNSGDSWVKQNSGTSNKLTDMKFFNTNEGFAVGENGTILQTNDGENWSDMTSTTTQNLYGMDFLSTTVGWAVGDNGTILYYGPAVSIKEENSQLIQCDIYPNPASGNTKISFNLANTGYVTLNILNSLGQVVSCLANDELKAGRHTFYWNAGDNPGGFYFMELCSGSRVLTQKIVVPGN